MAIVFKDSGALSSAIGSVGESIGTAITEASKKRTKSAKSKAFNTLLQEVIDEGGDVGQFLSSQVGIASPEDITSALKIHESQKKMSQVNKLNKMTKEERTTAFMKYGLSEEEAGKVEGMWDMSTPGGKTAIVKDLIERMRRGQIGDANQEHLEIPDKKKAPQQQQVPGEGQVLEEGQVPGEGQVNGDAVAVPTPKSTEIDADFVYPTVKEMGNFRYLTPKEVVVQRKDLRKETAPLAQANAKTMQNFVTIKARVNQLEGLNDSDKLPTGAQRLLLDMQTGKLKIPAAYNAETQTYAKIVNDFVSEAKDSFGARVTNFELDVFMQRLPTLANSAEGRKMIFKYMKHVIAIKEMYEGALQKVYDHYGTDKIDGHQADQLAREMIGDQQMDLVNDINVLEAESKDIASRIDNVPKGKTMVELNGEYFYLNKNDLPDARKRGAKISK